MTEKYLWVDDMRNIPAEYTHGEWDIARSFHEAIYLLERNDYQFVSLDHDLGSYYGGREMTGHDIVKWLVQRKIDGKRVPPRYAVHSANPEGAKRMIEMIEAFLQEEK